MSETATLDSRQKRCAAAIEKISGFLAHDPAYFREHGFTDEYLDACRDEAERLVTAMDDPTLLAKIYGPE